MASNSYRVLQTLDTKIPTLVSKSLLTFPHSPLHLHPKTEFLGNKGIQHPPWGTTHGRHSLGLLALATDLNHGRSLAPAPLPQQAERVCGEQAVFWGEESDRRGTETGLRGRSDLLQQVYIPAESCAESQVTCQAGQYIQISSFLKGLKSRGISTEGLV